MFDGGWDATLGASCAWTPTWCARGDLTVLQLTDAETGVRRAWPPVLRRA